MKRITTYCHSLEKLLFLNLILCILSCNQKDSSNITDKENLILLNTIQRTDRSFEPNKNTVYLIMPNEGCSGCISTGESFVKSQYDKHAQLKFIFTRTSSLKLLRNKLGKKVFTNKNVVIDSANFIRYPNIDKAIYPMVVYVNNGVIEKIRYQSPDQNGLSELAKYFAK